MAKKCIACDREGCPGPEQLREFLDWSDLASHVGEEKIVEWVNMAFNFKEAQKTSGKKYRSKQQLMVKVARQFLSPDELAEIERQAEERAL